MKYSVKLDENNYFTGTYGLILSEEFNPIPNGVLVENLPEDSSSYNFYFLNMESNEWVLDENKNIEEVKKIALEKLSMLCTKNINKTFISDALGYENVYSYDEEAQKNLLMIEQSLKYQDDNFSIDWRIHDTREVIPHSKEQFIELYLDSVSHVRFYVDKYREIEQNILTSNNIEELKQIMSSIEEQVIFANS